MPRRHGSVAAGWVSGALATVVLLCGCGGPATEFDAKSGAGGGASEFAPDFTLEDIDGNEVRLSDLEGRVRLIDFWATWCPPCREELPMLEHLEQTYAEHGLTVLGISDEDASVVGEFVRERGITYRNLIDPGEATASYMVLGLPTGFLVDRDGRIVERYSGPKPAKVLEARIRELLELPPAS